MPQSTWKFIGGPKRPRKSLEAAVAAVKKDPEGECGIYNSATGEMYTIIGELMVPLASRQVLAVARSLAVVAISDMQETPVPTKEVLRLASMAGEPVHGLVVGAAREIIAELKKAGEEDGGSGPEPSNESL